MREANVNEIWPMEPGWSCVYSEDHEMCRRLSESRVTEWFGTYTKGNKWLAEQYRFPRKDRTWINQILGSVAPK